MTPQPLLSICIPTYKMAAYLKILLEAIVEECRDVPVGAVEVVVCDNASPDETPLVVQSFYDHIPLLRYQRHSENIGPDRNFLAAVAASSGRFSWLMGSDDIVERGAITTLLHLIETHPDVCGFSLNRYARSVDLAAIIPENAFPAFNQTTILSGGQSVFCAISYYFGYLSGQVVHRETWSEVVRTKPIEAYYNAYVHVFVMAEMLKIRPDWVVVVDRLVGWRSGNDSFMADGRYRRLQIDVVGYKQIAAGVFGKGSPTYYAMRDTIATQHLRHHILAAMAEGSWTPVMARKTRSLALRHYALSWKFWWKTAPYLLAPSGLMLLAYRLRHRQRSTADA